MRDKDNKMRDKSVHDLLERFTAAWNAHNIEALLGCMAVDGVYYSSAGPNPSGAIFCGTSALRDSYSAIWKTYPDAKWSEVSHFVAGENACSQWLFSGTKIDGTSVEVRGCDLFKIRDDKISVKDSYRKQIVRDR